MSSLHWPRTTSGRLLLAVILAGVPAFGFGGGAIFSGAYLGPIPPDWFEDEPCADEPVSFLEDEFSREWQINATAVRDDGDAETFIRCVAHGNSQSTRCIAGLGDGKVIGCVDDDAPRAMPSDGDVVYFRFLKTDPDECELAISSHARFGTVDPKCRPGGGDAPTGDGDGDGVPGLDCEASNTVLLKAASTSKDRPIYLLRNGFCYEVGLKRRLRVRSIPSTDFELLVEDSSGHLQLAQANERGVAVVRDFTPGTTLFQVASTTGNDVTARVVAR